MNDKHLDYVDAVRGVIWGVIKVTSMLLFIVIMFYACSTFVDEQGSQAWFYKAGPAR